MVLQEAARIVKVQVGEGIVQITKQAALMRKLMDMALKGDMQAARLIMARLQAAQATADAALRPNCP